MPNLSGIGILFAGQMTDGVGIFGVVTAYQKHRVGIPPTRWLEDLVIVAGARWMREVQNWPLWQHLGEAYAQQWTSLG